MSVVSDLQDLGRTEGLGGHVVPVRVLDVGGDPGEQGDCVQYGAVSHATTLWLSKVER